MYTQNLPQQTHDDHSSEAEDHQHYPQPPRETSFDIDPHDLVADDVYPVEAAQHGFSREGSSVAFELPAIPSEERKGNAEREGEG